MCVLFAVQFVNMWILSNHYKMNRTHFKFVVFVVEMTFFSSSKHWPNRQESISVHFQFAKLNLFLW